MEGVHLRLPMAWRAAEIFAVLVASSSGKEGRSLASPSAGGRFWPSPRSPLPEAQSLRWRA